MKSFIEVWAARWKWPTSYFTIGECEHLNLWVINWVILHEMESFKTSPLPDNCTEINTSAKREAHEPTDTFAGQFWILSKRTFARFSSLLHCDPRPTPPACLQRPPPHQWAFTPSVALWNGSDQSGQLISARWFVQRIGSRASWGLLAGGFLSCYLSAYLEGNCPRKCW